jgi:hypothetical protein
MKKVLLIIMTAFLLVSCWKQDPPDSTPRKLPPRTGAYDTIHVYGPKQVWSVAEQEYISSYGWVKDTLIPTPEYLVTMNGEQVDKYADKSGNNGRIALGILVTLVLLIVTYFLIKNDKIKDTAKNFVRVFGVIIALVVGYITSIPADIAQLNSKTVHEKQLRYYQKIDPKLNYFWDSIYNNNKMLGARKK